MRLEMKRLRREGPWDESGTPSSELTSRCETAEKCAGH